MILLIEKSEIVKNLTNVKLVLGNGFDCYCGLKTKYSDYFSFCRNEHINIDKWKDSIKNAKEYLREISSNYLDLMSHIDLGDITFWDVYFYIVIKASDYNWCDIEEEMLQLLCKRQKNKPNIERIKFILTEKFKNLQDAIDDEYILAACLKQKYSKIINENNFYDLLLKELKKFEKKFGNYINEQYEDNKHRFKSMANVFFRQITCNNDYIVSKDTFNYTNTFFDDDKNYKFLSGFTHVNGDYLNPIFGIDSTNVSPQSDVYRFTKTSRRMLSDMESLNDMPVTIIEDISNLFIFGHSLNEQDYSYFFPLFDYLKINNPLENTKIVFIYSVYDETRKETIRKDVINRISKMVAAYDYYSTNHINGSRLLDYLTAKGRVILYEIKNLNVNYM